MYSNSFRVCVQHKLVQASPSSGECALRCTLRVNFVKSVMGMIKKQIRWVSHTHTHSDTLVHARTHSRKQRQTNTCMRADSHEHQNTHTHT